MAEQKGKAEEIMSGRIVKKPKRVQAKAECGFMDFYEDCRTHVKFLQEALSNPSLSTDVVLQYATIYSLIRIGENLTFLRDDEKFYKREWEDRQSDTGGVRTSPSQELSVIMSFIFFRNQLLHHHPYKSEGEKTAQLRQVFDEVINGRVIGDRRRPTGLSGLIGLLQEAYESAKILCRRVMPITSLKLSKPVGPAPTFDGTIQGCISSLQMEAGILKSIPGGTEPALISARRAAYLRCFQILDDLQKTEDIQINPRLIDGFTTILARAYVTRKCLAHVLSSTAEELAQTEGTLREINSDTFLQFVAAATLRLEELEKAKAILAPSQVEQKHEITETRQHSKMPIVVIPQKKLVLPLSEHPAQVSVRSSTDVDSSQLPKPITPLKATTEAQERASIAVIEPKKRPLVDYSSSGSDDDDAVDKMVEKGDTEKKEDPKQPPKYK